MLHKIKNRLNQSPALRAAIAKFKFWWCNNHWHENGHSNILTIDRAALESNDFFIDGNHNQLIFEKGSSVKNCTIKMMGHHHTLHIEEGVVLTQSLIWFEDEYCTIHFGAGTTMQRYGHIAVTEPGRKIIIGKNCMFSFNIDIRNGDSHSIFDVQSKKRFNHAKDVIIHDRVWLGAYAQVMGGADIGSDSIVGLRSLVNKPVPQGVIVAGIPAKIVRENVCWHPVRQEHMPS